MNLRVPAVPVALFAALLVSACSSSSTTGGGTSDAGSTADSGSGSDSGGTQDSGGGGEGGASVNGCTTYADHTASGDARNIPWDLAVASKPEHCMKITVGQSVTWTGSFSIHPLTASGGDPANPITNGTGASTTIAFPVAGTYGYICSVHGSMKGAIEVSP